MPTTDASSPEAATMAAAVPIEEYPTMVEVLTQHVLGPSYTFDTEFALGLDLVLDGIHRWLEAERRDLSPN